MGRKTTLPVLLSSLELEQLTAAAARVGVDPAVFLRSAGLKAARDVTGAHRPTYTREQLMSIHRKAQNKGHVWTEEELRERGLPLYWSETWVRRRVAEGATRAELAMESGSQERTVTSYLRKVWGIRSHQVVSKPVKEHVRELVAAGMSRRVIAQELGLSESTVGTYARSLPGEEERKFQRIATQVGTWPASRMHIAQTAFDGDGPATSAWLRYKVRRGWLVRTAPGVYALTDKVPVPDLQ